MAQEPKSNIQALNDAYLNDSVANKSIKPSQVNEIITDVTDSYVHKDEVSNSLINTSQTDVLAAAQGKILNDKILAMAGSLIAQGNWDALTNTPDITTTTNAGYFWIVSVDGATDLGGMTDWKVNDWAVYTSNGWAKVDNTDKVTSVDGQNGAVDLTGTYLLLTGGTLTGLLNVNGGIVATKQEDGAEVLKLNTERSWSFYQDGAGSVTNLLLGDNNGGKTFKIGLGFGNGEVGTQFLTPAQGGYAKLQIWKGSDVNNIDVAFVDSNGVGSFDGGVVVPSVTNNGIKSTRYRYEVSGQNWSTGTSKIYSYASIGFGGDWKKVSVVSVVVYDNLEGNTYDASSFGCVFSFSSSNVIIGITNTIFNGNLNFDNHKVVIIIEENI